MLNIAIVEDNTEDACRLENYIDRYAKEAGVDMRSFTFSRAVAFLNKFQSQFDIVFQDIELPDMNGIEVARKMRERDSAVVLIFVTNLAQYAIKGYEVDALDYVMKPLSYSAFCLKIQRAIIRCQREKQRYITVSNKDNIVRIKATELKYIEIYQHRIVYHTSKGDYNAYGVLSKVEASLPKRGFFRCGSSYIINFRHVDWIDGNEVAIGSVRIPISRTRKKELLTEFHRFYSDIESGA